MRDLSKRTMRNHVLLLSLCVMAAAAGTVGNDWRVVLVRHRTWREKDPSKRPGRKHVEEVLLRMPSERDTCHENLFSTDELS